MPHSLTYAAQPAEGFVYVMECAGYYKIGWAKLSPTRRKRNLQIGNPLPITLVGAIEGSMLVEAEWHETFKDKCVQGEWFALTDEDVATVLHENWGLDRIPADDDIA